MFESGHWKSPTLTQSQYEFISQLVQCHPANIDLHATGDQVQLLGSITAHWRGSKNRWVDRSGGRRRRLLDFVRLKADAA